MPRKSKEGMRVDLNTDAMLVKFSLMDFEADKILRVEEYQAEGMPGDIGAMLTLYGLSKVLQDRTSGVGKENKADKFAAMDEVWSRLSDGEWKAERKRGTVTVRVEVEALADMKGCGIPDIQRALKDYDEAQKQKIFAAEDLKPFITAAQAKRDKAEVVDLGSLLAEEPDEE